MRTIYLGDGAYAAINRDFQGQVIIFANGGSEREATDAVHLSSEMVDHLQDQIKQDFATTKE